MTIKDVKQNTKYANQNTNYAKQNTNFLRTFFLAKKSMTYKKWQIWDMTVSSEIQYSPECTFKPLMEKNFYPARAPRALGMLLPVTYWQKVSSQWGGRRLFGASDRTPQPHENGLGPAPKRRQRRGLKPHFWQKWKPIVKTLIFGPKSDFFCVWW